MDVFYIPRHVGGDDHPLDLQIVVEFPDSV